MHLESSVIFENTVADVFSKVTDIKKRNWRSDLKVVKGIDDNNFIEYSKKNYPTFYTITKSTKNKTYELDFTNNKVEGHITYSFKKEENKTNVMVAAELTLVETKFAVLTKQKLKSQWKKFIEDLSRIEK